MKFLLDTNFLISIVSFKIDMIDELSKFGKPELFVLSFVVNELKKIVRKGGKSSIYGKIALELIKRNDIRILQSKENVDEEMVKLSKNGFIICTIDKKLSKTIRKDGKRIVSIRQRKYLELV